MDPTPFPVPRDRAPGTVGLDHDIPADWGPIVERLRRAVRQITPLFGIYMRYGARVCSPPALDRDFGTVDFFVLCDVEAMDARSRKMLFAEGRPAWGSLSSAILDLA